MSALSVQQAMSPLKLSFAPEQTLLEAEMLLREKTESGAPVIDQDGQLLGVLMRENIQVIPPEDRTTLQVKDAMSNTLLTISPDDRLDEALEKLSNKRIDWAPVVNAESTVSKKPAIAVLSVGDIIRTYREILTKSPHHIRGLVDGTVMLETMMEPGMQLVGRPLREAKLPEETLVISIRREGTLIFPRGSSVIQSGDIVAFMVSPRGEERLRQYLRLSGH